MVRDIQSKLAHRYSLSALSDNQLLFEFVSGNTSQLEREVPGGGDKGGEERSYASSVGVSESIMREKRENISHLYYAREKRK